MFCHVSIIQFSFFHNFHILNYIKLTSKLWWILYLKLIDFLNTQNFGGYKLFTSK